MVEMVQPQIAMDDPHVVGVSPVGHAVDMCPYNCLKRKHGRSRQVHVCGAKP